MSNLQSVFTAQSAGLPSSRFSVLLEEEIPPCSNNPWEQVVQLIMKLMASYLYIMVVGWEIDDVAGGGGSEGSEEDGSGDLV